MYRHSKHKKKKQQQQQQQYWGEPKYHEEYKRWYQELIDLDDKILEYQWLDASYTGPTEPDRPRSSDIDVLANGVGVIDLEGYPEPSTIPADQAYPTSPGYTHSTPLDNHAQDSIPHGGGDAQYEDSASLPPGNSPSYQSDKGKGKAHEHYDSGSSATSYATADRYAEAQSPYTYMDNVSTHSSSRSTDGDCSPPHTTDTTYPTQDDQVYEAAILQSREEYYGHPTTYGESSSAAYAALDPPAAYGTGSGIIDDLGTLTPRAGSPVHKIEPIIRGTEGAFEALDPQFRVSHSSNFYPGAVFKVLWAEPMGAACTGKEDPISEIHHINKFYYGIRRFIVVAADEGHSTCVPILTYERRACTKRGVKASKHGIVYAKGHSAKMVKGEPQLGFGPVAMRIHAPDEKLARESRINYSKLVTIEHNVKVFFFGVIEGDDLENVQSAVDSCWMMKKLQHQKKSKR